MRGKKRFSPGVNRRNECDDQRQPSARIRDRRSAANAAACVGRSPKIIYPQKVDTTPNRETNYDERIETPCAPKIVNVVRVPGVSRERRVIALDSQQQELPASKYSTRLQPDGSQVVRMSAAVLNGHTIQLQARGADGSSEPLACVTGESDRERQ